MIINELTELLLMMVVASSPANRAPQHRNTATPQHRNTATQRRLTTIQSSRFWPMQEESNSFAEDEVFGGRGDALVDQLMRQRTCMIDPISLISEGRCIKLVQHTPAWALHALMRFNGVRYVTCNSEFQYAFGTI